MKTKQYWQKRKNFITRQVQKVAEKSDFEQHLLIDEATKYEENEIGEDVIEVKEKI